MDRISSPPGSQVVGKVTFFGDIFLADLYHPRAVSWMVELQQQFLGLQVAMVGSTAAQRPIPSSSGGTPCTTGDAWLYRDLLSDISGWLFAWLAVVIEPAQIQSPTACMIRRRRLARDDWA